MRSNMKQDTHMVKMSLTNDNNINLDKIINTLAHYEYEEKNGIISDRKMSRSEFKSILQNCIITEYDNFVIKAKINFGDKYDETKLEGFIISDLQGYANIYRMFEKYNYVEHQNKLDTILDNDIENEDNKAERRIELLDSTNKKSTEIDSTYSEEDNLKMIEVLKSHNLLKTKKDEKLIRDFLETNILPTNTWDDARLKEIIHKYYKIK